MPGSSAIAAITSRDFLKVVQQSVQKNIDTAAEGVKTAAKAVPAGKHDNPAHSRSCLRWAGRAPSAASPLSRQTRCCAEPCYNPGVCLLTAPTLLLTKLNRPPVVRDRIDRPRLTAMLDRGMAGPMTLVSAAAGFGKTTLVSAWIDSLSASDRLPTPAAWLSLDENDSDLEVFLLYFVAAIRTVCPAACAETLALLQARRAPEQAPLLITFSNELEQLPARVVLVLDDYHTIRGEAVHDFLGEVIRRWTQRLHLVLISRSSPPLPLALLRAQGQVTVIHTRDLRFTPEESAAFLNNTLAAPLSPAAVALLDQHIEGWIAGLRLASLSLRDAADVESEVAGLSGGNVEIADYLMDQVVSRQPRAIVKFLLVTSILNRFCAPLCERVARAVASSGGSWRNARDCIQWLERTDLFVVPLDNNGEWYRYHHLFQTLLQRRALAEVGPEQVSELHRTAAAWFAQQGLIDEAIQHALAIDDLDLAASLMASGFCAVLNREDRATLERWLRLLPEDFIKRRPWLLLMEAWALQFSWQLSAVAKLLGQIEALLDEGGEAAARSGDLPDLAALRGLIAAFRGQEVFTYMHDAARAIALLRGGAKAAARTVALSARRRFYLLGHEHARHRRGRRRPTHPAARV